MRFLADEDVYAITVRWLRAAGHDVLAVAETARNGLSDADVWAWAGAESRVLVTRDKEFGRRFLAEPCIGLIFLRGKYEELPAVHSVLSRALGVLGPEILAMSMLVVTPRRYRHRLRPVGTDQRGDA